MMANIINSNALLKVVYGFLYSQQPKKIKHLWPVVFLSNVLLKVVYGFL